MNSTTVKDEYIRHLPGDALLSIARNDSANRDYRRAAVELLIDGKHPQAKHPELAITVSEIMAERAAKGEVVALVEEATGQELPENGHALKAGVTTASLMQSEPAPLNGLEDLAVRYIKYALNQKGYSPAETEDLVKSVLVPDASADSLMSWVEEIPAKD